MSAAVHNRMRRFFSLFLGLGLGASFVALATAQTVPVDPPDVREGVLFGLGLGIGGAHRTGQARLEGGMGNFRIGYAVRPDLAVHYEGSVFFNPSYSGQAFFTNVAAVTYFEAVAGVFLRGGMGIGTSPKMGPESGTLPLPEPARENGLALLAAVGYEFHLSERFALAPHVEFTYHNWSSSESGNIIAGGIGFNRYSR